MTLREHRDSREGFTAQDEEFYNSWLDYVDEQNALRDELLNDDFDDDEDNAPDEMEYVRYEQWHDGEHVWEYPEE
jgi:hypothetical protein